MKTKKEYWIIPPEIYKELDKEFNFDFDPCPYPHPEGFDGTVVEWGKSNWCNPPFRKSDGKFGKGPTAFIRKAIEENKKGKDVVIIINTNAFINMLIDAGAEMRSMGRVKWLDGKTGEPWKSPACTTLFVLRRKTPLFPSCGCGKYFHHNHPVVSVPSKEKILDVVMNSEFYKNIIQYKEAKNFTKELKNLVNDLHTLLTEGK